VFRIGQLFRAGLNPAALSVSEPRGNVEMNDAAPDSEPDRAWMAREVNKHIRDLSERLHDERPIGFFCECGCMGLVVTTPAVYDEQGGAWCENHKPE
jgi:hypothetical protein